MNPCLICIAGPTAVGKSAVGVCLAKALNAEVVSCDSMQVYRGMRIVSSQPSLKERRGIRHYLTGYVPAEQSFNVACYCRDAAAAIRLIVKRKKVPILVGGTGLYLGALIDGIFPMDAPDPRIRVRLQRRLRQEGVAGLFVRLQKIDPEAASRIHPHDAKRIVRALEVYEASGLPISVLQKRRVGLGAEYSVRLFCLTLPLEKLYQRIEERVESMFRRGLVREIDRLRAKRLSKTSCFALGIREVGEYLDGNATLEQAKESLKLNTRHYARRQLTWFRKDRRFSWINVEEHISARETAETIIRRLSWNERS